MEERLTKLQAILEADKGLAEKLFSLENPEEVQAFLKEQGLEFSLEEIDLLRQALVKAVEKGDSGELSDEDLEDVAGGIVAATVIGIIGLVIAGVGVAGQITDSAVRSRW